MLDILRLEIERRNIEVRLSEEVHRIKTNKGKQKLVVVGKEADKESGKKNGKANDREYDAVIITCGGCAAPGTGSNGDGHKLAESLGHRIIPTVPALVQLRCSDDFFKMAAGVRCEALLKLYSKEASMQKNAPIQQQKLIQEEQGELQFTDYGISGIPVFQFSRQAAYELRKKKKFRS